MMSALFLPAAVINLASSTAMALRVAMLLMALLAASSAYSPVGVSLVSRSRVLPARPHGCVLLLHASALTAPGSLHCQRHALKDTTCGVRRLHRLRMEETAGEKAEEAAPAASVDFTPATPTPAAEEDKGFDPTQCAAPTPCTRVIRRPAQSAAGTGAPRLHARC